MIISCEKCNKKFELDENLIPETGRLLQCGSCSHKWHYMPEKIINLNNEINITDNYSSDEPLDTTTNKIKKKKSSIKKESSKSTQLKKTNKKSGIGFLSYLLVILISFIAILLIIETFKTQISLIIPGVDFYISSLYESLKDIFLFFNDLLN